MKVLDLQCGQQHSFEGWFGSEEDFQSQLARGIVECPVCADKTILKMPSAPRLNFGAHREPTVQAPLPDDATPPGPPEAQPGSSLTPVAKTAEMAIPSLEQQAAFLKALRHVIAHSEDVGERFADQARAMHYGDAEPRSIRGQATPREASELIEEGIDVMALPMSAALKETLQ